MTNTPGMTLEEIHALVAAREVTARELAETHLDALERAHGACNAVARLEPEHALAAADSLDARLAAGETPGPLFAAPLAHKDLYAREGWPMEAGSAILRGNRATETSSVVAGLDAAGALDLARLNTVEFALGTEGRNFHTGTVRNPWNAGHSPGGSSSGSAAAVAAGAVPAAMGSDTGGSVRLPAAACGIVGLKPTAGVIGRGGIFPLAASLDTPGPLCLTVRDTALMMNALEGHDPADPQSVDLGPRDHMAGIEDGLAGLRIGVGRSYFFDPVTPAVGDVLEGAIRLAEAEGAALSEVTLPGIERANRLNMTIIAVEAAALHRPWLETRAGDYGPETLARLMAGLFVPATAYLDALAGRRRLLAAALDTAFAEADVLLTPSWPVEVPEIVPDGAPGFGAAAEDTGHCSRPFNYLGLPAIVIPCGVSANGLPVGVQLVARPYAEPLLLRAARGLERALAFRDSHRPAAAA